MFRQEARLAAVAALSRSLLQELAPDELANFSQDFPLWLATSLQMAVKERLLGEDLLVPLGGETARGQISPRPARPTQSLDTTLVAGMFLQVMLEAEHLPGTPLERTCFVKQAVKNFLVQRLAGQITLSQFFRLVQVIEQEVGYYFQRLQGQWLGAGDLPERPGEPVVAAEPAVRPEILLSDLQAALSCLPLPQQANRKLSPEGLLAFLAESQGKWFRLMDFESHFRLNKKTAWSYLTLLLHSEILRHNEQKANKVRYALATRFLSCPPGQVA